MRSRTLVDTWLAQQKFAQSHHVSLMDALTPGSASFFFYRTQIFWRKYLVQIGFHLLEFVFWLRLFSLEEVQILAVARCACWIVEALWWGAMEGLRSAADQNDKKLLQAETGFWLILAPLTGPGTFAALLFLVFLRSEDGPSGSTFSFNLYLLILGVQLTLRLVEQTLRSSMAAWVKPARVLRHMQMTLSIGLILSVFFLIQQSPFILHLVLLIYTMVFFDLAIEDARLVFGYRGYGLKFPTPKDFASIFLAKMRLKSLWRPVFGLAAHGDALLVFGLFFVVGDENPWKHPFLFFFLLYGILRHATLFMHSFRFDLMRLKGSDLGLMRRHLFKNAKGAVTLWALCLWLFTIPLVWFWPGRPWALVFWTLPFFVFSAWASLYRTGDFYNHKRGNPLIYLASIAIYLVLLSKIEANTARALLIAAGFLALQILLPRTSLLPEERETICGLSQWMSRLAALKQSVRIIRMDFFPFSQNRRQLVEALAAALAPATITCPEDDKLLMCFTDSPPMDPQQLFEMTAGRIKRVYPEQVYGSGKEALSALQSLLGFERSEERSLDELIAKFQEKPHAGAYLRFGKDAQGKGSYRRRLKVLNAFLEARHPGRSRVPTLFSEPEAAVIHGQVQAIFDTSGNRPLRKKISNFNFSRCLDGQ